MEATQTNSEALNEGVKGIEKLFNDSSSAMMDIYKKQMDLTAGFYNNLFNMGKGNSNGAGQNSGTSNMFASMDMTKWLTNPFANFSSTDMQNPVLTSIDKTMKQLMELNQKCLSTFTNSVQIKGTNSESMSEEYKKLLEGRLNDSKEMLNTIAEAFNRRLEYSMATNKKAMEEIVNQCNLAQKQNQKLFADMVSAHQTSLINEEKKHKETHTNESKTPFNRPAELKGKHTK